ncbi:MAG: T9SS type A sorting domain-containing protein [Bacteroidales bacterium]|nr:T9SS type A sorting domain-containing protein [Bacteroidales bacterium]
MKLSFISSIYVILVFLSIHIFSSGQIPTNGLVAYYPFNGNANDESGNGNNGIADSQVGFASNSAGSYAQYTLGFSNYTVAIPASTSLDFSTASGITFSAWIRDDNECESCEFTVLSRLDGSGSNNHEFALKIKEGLLTGILYNSPTSDTLKTSKNLIKNRWYHIVLIWNGQNSILSYYIDGVLDTTKIATIISLQNTQQSINIGFFIGAINDLRIYNRALNEPEVSALYAEGLWPLQEKDNGNLTDFRDGTTYQTEKIGNQWWTRENMAYAPEELTDYGYFPYPNGYEMQNGILYTLNFYMQSCPCGWHVPSYAEWDELATYLGGRENAGGKMKEDGTLHWTPPNIAATNESGFTALPTGKIDYVGDYTGYGDYTQFWSSSGHHYYGGYQLITHLSFNSSFLDYGMAQHYEGLSVRCVRDSESLDSDNDGIPNCQECIEFNANLDTDNDSIPNSIEDINQDGDFENDDTDSDGLPNFIDTDDDGDGTPTVDEDSNHDGDPTNDDSNNNGVPDYKEPMSNRHFNAVFAGDGIDCMYFTATSAKINGSDMQPGDEIGIFDGGLCVGRGILTVIPTSSNPFEIKVSRDNPETPYNDGYTVGHQASFKIWDTSEQKESSVYEITFLSGDNNFATGVTSTYQINYEMQTDQLILLAEGWNIISFHVVPDIIDMMQIVQPLIQAGNLVKLQDEAGASIEINPLNTNWFNNIGNWSISEGYKLRTNTPGTFSVTGLPSTQAMEIPLLTGWNIIGYPYSSPQNAMTLLSELISSGSLRKVQDESGNAIEPLAGYTGWIDNVVEFNPGKGYKIRVSGDALLTINPPGPGGLKSTRSEASVPHHFKTAWMGNGYDHMNVYLSVDSEDGSTLQPGDEIAVYDGILCVGAFRIGNQPQSQHLLSLIVSADDPTTSETDGFTTGNTMEFRVWRAADNAEIMIQSVDYLPGYFEAFEPLGTTMALLNVESSAMNTLTTSLGDNYPNPFREETIISYTIGEKTEVDIAIYNMLGQRVKTLVMGLMEQGSFETIWDGTNQHKDKVSAGIYWCRMVVKDEVIVKIIELF